MLSSFLTPFLYYKQLVAHLGSAARYQFLASIFANQKIKGMDNRVPAIQGKMGGLKYYSFSIEPEKHEYKRATLLQYPIKEYLKKLIAWKDKKLIKISDALKLSLCTKLLINKFKNFILFTIKDCSNLLFPIFLFGNGGT